MACFYAPNGQLSNLYEEAKNIYGEKVAEKIWRYVRTPQFISKFGNWKDASELLSTLPKDSYKYQATLSKYSNISPFVDNNFEPKLVYLNENTNKSFNDILKRFIKNDDIKKIVSDIGPKIIKRGRTTQIKEGVTELFESNPELANAVYEALGFNQIITPKDKIIFGHPGIGKTFAKKSNNFIDVDEDYKEEHTMQKILRANAKNTGKKEDLKEWEDYVTTWWNKVKDDAKKSGKQIFVSNLPILRLFPQDFDKVINISKAKFIERAKQRNDYKQGETEDWKNSLDIEIAKINRSKVVNTEEYLSDLFITPQQKQQALQQYSAYLDSIFPDSQVKDIVYHISPNKFDTFDNKYIGSKKEKASPDNSMGIFFSKNKNYIKTQDTNNELGDTIYPTLVNLKNPYPNWLSELRVFVTGNLLDESSRKEYESYKKWMINNNYDGFLEESKRELVVVFDAKDTHILGNKQDIERFKEFISKPIIKRARTTEIKPGVEELFNSNPELANAVYEILDIKQDDKITKDDKYTLLKDELDKILQISDEELEKNEAYEFYYNFKSLASLIKNKLQNYPIKVYYKEIESDVIGEYNEYHKRIIISPNQNYTEKIKTLLHEAIHALTRGTIIDSMFGDKKFYDLIDSYRKKVINKIEETKDDLNWDYETSDNDEFLAAIFTEPLFRDILKSIPSEKSNNKTLWDDILDFLKKLIGIKRKNTLLEDVINDTLDNLEDFKNKKSLIDSDKKKIQQLYSQYLDTIFPDSKVKDIVYHGSSQKINQFEVRKEPLIHFGSKNAALQKGNVLNQVLLNIKNLETIKDGMWFLGTDKGGLLKELLDRKILTIEEVISINEAKNKAVQQSLYFYENYRMALPEGEKAGNKKLQEILKDKNIGFEYVNFSEDKGSTSYAVPSQKQIHILGSQQDIEGFKQFASENIIKKARTTEIEKGVEESLQESLNILLKGKLKDSVIFTDDIEGVYHSMENYDEIYKSISLANLLGVDDLFVLEYFKSNKLKVAANKIKTKEQLYEQINQDIQDNFNIENFLVAPINREKQIKEYEKAKERDLINNGVISQETEMMQYENYWIRTIEEVNRQRKENLKDWLEYITNDNPEYSKNPAFQYLIWKSITKEYKVDKSTLKSQPPVLNRRVLADLYGLFLNKTILPTTSSFKENYDNLLIEYNKQNSEITQVKGKSGGVGEWITIKGKNNDPDNFNENVKKLRSLAYTSWCVKTSMAESYLLNGDFYIYIEKDDKVTDEFLMSGKDISEAGIQNVKVGIGTKYNGSIEIQGQQNDNSVPLDYYEQIKEFTDKKGLNSVDDRLEEAKKKFEQIQKYKNYIKENQSVSIKFNNTLQYLKDSGSNYKVLKNGKIIINNLKVSNNLKATFDNVIELNRIEWVEDFSEIDVDKLGNQEILDLFKDKKPFYYSPTENLYFPDLEVAQDFKINVPRPVYATIVYTQKEGDFYYNVYGIDNDKYMQLMNGDETVYSIAKLFIIDNEEEAIQQEKEDQEKLKILQKKYDDKLGTYNKLKIVKGTVSSTMSLPNLVIAKRLEAIRKAPNLQIVTENSYVINPSSVKYVLGGQDNHNGNANNAKIGSLIRGPKAKNYIEKESNTKVLNEFGGLEKAKEYLFKIENGQYVGEYFDTVKHKILKALPVRHYEDVYNLIQKIAPEIITQNWRFKGLIDYTTENGYPKLSKLYKQGIQAFYNNKTGKVYVSNNLSEQDKEQVLLHEVIGHKGIEELLSDLEYNEYKNIMFGIKDYLYNNAKYLLNRTGHKSISDLAKDYQYDENTEKGQLSIIKELLARQAESNPQLNWFQRFIGKLQLFLAKIFGYNVSKEGVIELLLLSRDKLNNPNLKLNNVLDAFSTRQDLNFQQNKEFAFGPIIKKGRVTEIEKLEEKIVNGFLKDFGITINEYNSIKEELGFDAYSMSDLITKNIAVEKGESILPETAYFAYQMLGKQNNKIRSELRYLVNKWDKYSQSFNKHKKIISKQEGFLSNKQEWKNKIKDLVILDFLQENIKNHYENPQTFIKQNDSKWTGEDFTLWKKILREIENFLNLFKLSLKSNKKKKEDLNNLGLSIADEILNQNYQYYNYNLKEDQIQKYYKNTIDSDPFAKELVRFGQEELKLILTGSLALRKAGTVYRIENETLHDIDWVIPFETAISSKENSKVLYNIQRYQDDDNISFAAEEAMNYVENFDWFKKIKEKYPTYKTLIGFYGIEHKDNFGSLTVTGVIDGEFYTEDGYHEKEVSYYKKDPETLKPIKVKEIKKIKHSKGDYIEDTGYIVDFFIRLKPKQEQHENYFKLWKEIMIAKIKMGRDKDFIDWKAFTPYLKSKDSFNFNYEGFRHINWKEDNQSNALEENIIKKGRVKELFGEQMEYESTLDDYIILPRKKETPNKIGVTQPSTSVINVEANKNIKKLNSLKLFMINHKESKVLKVGDSVEVYFNKSDSISVLTIKSIKKINGMFKIELSNNSGKTYTYDVDRLGKGEIIEVEPDNKLLVFEKDLAAFNNASIEFQKLKEVSQPFIQGKIPAPTISNLEKYTIARYADQGVPEKIQDEGYKLTFDGHPDAIFYLKVHRFENNEPVGWVVENVNTGFRASNIKDTAEEAYKDFMTKLTGAIENVDISNEKNVKVINTAGFDIEKLKPSTQPTTTIQEVKKEPSTINIYSTDKNGFEKLSNLLNGPVVAIVDGKELKFKTVEHFYQVKKALFAGDRNAANKIYTAENGFDAQQLGSKKKGIIEWKTNKPQDWDNIAAVELESGMRLSFAQNKEMRDLLVATGDAKLTHKKENINLGVWEEKFPEILEGIRNDINLNKPLIVSFDDIPEFDTERKKQIISNFIFKHKKYKMTEAQAKLYITQALIKKDRNEIINKLKDCY